MFMSMMLRAAEKALNRYLKLDPETNRRLEVLDGKVILLEPQNFNFKIYWLFSKAEISLLSKFEGPADVILQGSPLDFLQLNSGPSTSAALMASDIQVTGDMDVAQHFKALFAELEIDWEEQLSHVTGDIIAHKTGNLVRGLCTWAKQTTTTVQQDVSEYIQEEARWLPPREELQNFYNQVDTLRNDTDRLELRLDRLQKNFSK